MSKKLAKLPTLQECEAGLAAEWQTLHALARKSKYRAIAVGLWLLKALEIHRLPTGRKPASVSAQEMTPTVGVIYGNEGFDAWLASTAPSFGFSRSTGYNWMNAALNAGLTATSTLEDVAKLEETDALADRKLTAHDLYSPPRLEDPDPKPAPRIRPEEKAQQAWFPFFIQLESYSNEEKELNLLNALPVTTVDPTKEVSLQDLENKLEHALIRVREVKKEKLLNEPRRRRSSGPPLIDVETEPAA